jgi:mono/diheme cytochrome c family protein
LVRQPQAGELLWKEATMTCLSHYKLACLLLVTLVGVATAAYAIEAISEDADDRGRTWRDGAAVYNGVCVYCHEQKLRGAGMSPAKIRFTVRHGHLAMPAFRSTEIDDAALEQLIQYLSSKKPVNQP